MPDRLIFRRYQSIVSVSVFLFFFLMLLVPSGYSYGSTLLLITGLVFLTHRRSRTAVTNHGMRFSTLTGDDRCVIGVLLAVFLVTLLLFVMHGNPVRFMDQNSRYLLAIPVLVLLVKVPPRPSHIWAGLVTGSIGAAGIAVWQVHYEGIQRATGFVTSAIPFGDLALTMGVFCASGMAWASTRQPYAWHWRVALAIGTLAGGYASVASGSRGGWLALGPVALLFAIAFFQRHNVKYAIVAAMVGVALAVGIFASPHSMVRMRYDQALHEINNYVQSNDASTSIGARLEIWRAGALLVQQRPLLGWPEAEYRNGLAQLVSAGNIDPFVLGLSNTHNNYLQVWVSQGLVGLSALLALFVVPFWLFSKRLRAADAAVRSFALCGASLVACFAVFSLTQVILGRNNGVIFFGMSLVILWASVRGREDALLHDER